jgi:hypothetical protein
VNIYDNNSIDNHMQTECIEVVVVVITVVVIAVVMVVIIVVVVKLCPNTLFLSLRILTDNNNIKDHIEIKYSLRSSSSTIPCTKVDLFFGYFQNIGLARKF